jgi:hypothetical protein
MNRQKRKAEMERMRFEELMTLQEIGDEFDISRERVRQIIGNTGYDVFQTKNEIRNVKIKQSKLSTAKVAKKHNVSYGFVSRIRTNHHNIEGGSQKKGQDAERYISDKLKNMRIRNKLMPVGHPFDILVFNKLRVDVKACYHGNQYKNLLNPRYHFNIDSNRRGKYCDFLIFVIWESKDCFVIPFDKVGYNKNNVFFCWPTARPEIGKYQKYHNRWDLLIPNNR